jgi:ATP-dependent RNA helicase DDX51/DBP6
MATACDVLWHGRTIIVNSSQLEENEVDASEEDNVLKECPQTIQDVFYNTLKFSHLTPIQKAAIHFLLKPKVFNLVKSSTCDVVITAPTGEGKTLCYVLPIVSCAYFSELSEILALVVAPTRELTEQISAVFSLFCNKSQNKNNLISVICLSNNEKLCEEFKSLQTYTESSCLNTVQPFLEKRSPKIIIGTPGRFVDHFVTNGDCISVTLVQSLIENITFQKVKEKNVSCWSHLQWIVMDEADRLLDQRYQNWINEVNKIASFCVRRPQRIIVAATMTINPEKLNVLNLCRPLYFTTNATDKMNSYTIPSTLIQKWILCPSVMPTVYSGDIKPLTLLYLLHQLYTLPQDKITSIGSSDNSCSTLKKQKKSESNDFSTYIEEKSYSTKKNLKVLIFCSTKKKAVFISQLINIHFQWGHQDMLPEYISLINLKTVEKATGNDLEEILAETTPRFSLQSHFFTSDLSLIERKRLLRQFEKRKHAFLDILVASDVLTRGLDVKGLDIVINYDCPVNLRNYIHRAGRTARAGQYGLCFTLVTLQELPLFKSMLKKNLLSCNDSCIYNTMGYTLTLWDLVHKHSINLKHILPWLDNHYEMITTNSLDNNTSNSSYYLKLLQEINLLNELRTKKK